MRAGRGFGVIGALCAALAGCDGGNATVACTPDEITCGTACVDPRNDLANCGQCGNACEGDQVCGDGQCAEMCPAEQEVCAQTCVDTTTDREHCGACDSPCTADEECRAGSCEVRCDVGLVMPMPDPWGAQWDGVERTAATLADAEAACAGIGARLPTPTELYRVSATQSGAVGTATMTAPLWSGAPAERTTQTALRLSDGVASVLGVATVHPYRCVCEPPQPAFFGGTRCFGPAGDECVSVGNANIDKSDRPAIRRSSAIWECAREHAHLADFPLIAQAIQAGAPGSNAYIATADHADYRQSSTVRWTAAAGWVVSGNVSQALLQNPMPFRCAGSSFVSGTHPNAITNEYVGPGGLYKSDAVDAASSTWIAAHDRCFARGGHLPRAAELAELIMQGLPNGTNTYQWSADQVGYDGDNQFLAASMRWQGTDPRMPYEYSTTSTWDYKTGSMPSRCVYYPVDPMWQPPTTCSGGCFTVTPPVGPARVVMDSTDRAVVRMEVAIAACAAEGGRLASERDYTEAIRAGLPNGTNEFNLTSDLAQGNVMVVRWTNTAFTDQYSTYSTWVGPTTARAYRCAWTNEIR
jgi:hypothetical protein